MRHRYSWISHLESWAGLSTGVSIKIQTRKTRVALPPKWNRKRKTQCQYQDWTSSLVKILKRKWMVEAVVAVSQAIWVRWLAITSIANLTIVFLGYCRRVIWWDQILAAKSSIASIHQPRVSMKPITNQISQQTTGPSNTDLSLPTTTAPSLKNTHQSEHANTKDIPTQSTKPSNFKNNSHYSNNNDIPVFNTIHQLPTNITRISNHLLSRTESLPLISILKN